MVRHQYDTRNKYDLQSKIPYTIYICNDDKCKVHVYVNLQQNINRNLRNSSYTPKKKTMGIPTRKYFL